MEIIIIFEVIVSAHRRFIKVFTCSRSKRKNQQVSWWLNKFICEYNNVTNNSQYEDEYTSDKKMIQVINQIKRPAPFVQISVQLPSLGRDACRRVLFWIVSAIGGHQVRTVHPRLDINDHTDRWNTYWIDEFINHMHGIAIIVISGYNHWNTGMKLIVTFELLLLKSLIKMYVVRYRFWDRMKF